MTTYTQGLYKLNLLKILVHVFDLTYIPEKRVLNSQLIHVLVSLCILSPTPSI